MWNRRLNEYGLEVILGFIKQNAYGAPQGVCCFLCVFYERNQKCASHNPRERHPTVSLLSLPVSSESHSYGLIPHDIQMKNKYTSRLRILKPRVFPFVYRAGSTSEQSPAMFNSDLAPNTHFHWSSLKQSGQMWYESVTVGPSYECLLNE